MSATTGRRRACTSTARPVPGRASRSSTRGPARAPRGRGRRLRRRRGGRARARRRPAPPSRALTGFAAADVVFTTGVEQRTRPAARRLDRSRARVACLPGEFGPNLLIMARHGFDVRPLPVDGAGRLDVDAAERALAADPPALVHLTPLGSHRGIVPSRWPRWPTVCRAQGIPLIVDAAQALRHLDCADTAPMRSTRRRANGRPGRAVSGCWRCGRTSRNGCGRGCHRRVGAADQRGRQARARRGQRRRPRRFRGRGRRAPGARPGADPARTGRDRRDSPGPHWPTCRAGGWSNPSTNPAPSPR